MTDLFQHLTEQVFRTADVVKPRLSTIYGPASDIAVGMPDYPGDRSVDSAPPRDLAVPSDAPDFKMPHSFVPQIALPADAPVPSLRQLRTALAKTADDVFVNAEMAPAQEETDVPADAGLHTQELNRASTPSRASDVVSAEVDQRARLTTPVISAAVDHRSSDPSRVDKATLRTSRTISDSDKAMDVAHGADLVNQPAIAGVESNPEQTAEKAVTSDALSDQTTDAGPVGPVRQPESHSVPQPVSHELTISSSNVDSTEVRYARSLSTNADVQPTAAIDDDRQNVGENGEGNDVRRLNDDQPTASLSAENGRVTLPVKLDAAGSASLSAQRAVDERRDFLRPQSIQSNVDLTLPPRELGTQQPTPLPPRASNEQDAPRLHDSVEQRLSEDAEDLASPALLRPVQSSPSAPQSASTEQQPAARLPQSTRPRRAKATAGSVAAQEQVDIQASLPSTRPIVQGVSSTAPTKLADDRMQPDRPPQALPMQDGDDIQQLSIDAVSSVRETPLATPRAQALPFPIARPGADAVDQTATTQAVEAHRTDKSQTAPMLKPADSSPIDIDTETLAESAERVGETASRRGLPERPLSAESSRVTEPTVAEPARQQSRATVMPQPRLQSPPSAPARQAKPAAAFEGDLHTVDTSAFSGDSIDDSVPEFPVRSRAASRELAPVRRDTTKVDADGGGLVTPDTSIPTITSARPKSTPVVSPVLAGEMSDEMGLEADSTVSHKSSSPSTATASPQLSSSDTNQNNLTAELKPAVVARSRSSESHVVDNVPVPAAPVQRSTREMQSRSEESSLQDYPGVESDAGSGVPTSAKPVWNPNSAVRPQVSIPAAQGRETAPDAAAVAPTVHVTIGRVEVRTKATEKPPVSVRRRPAKSALSLDAYLNGGQAQNS